ncbi:MAG: hypothetical protein NTV34_03020 [Proteobacteria bacterium]|nr:hypothetical protein [Pseudomonadota bacterium]
MTREEAKSKRLFATIASDDEISFGPVAVSDREYAGKNYCYDDHEGSFAIAYFVKPFESEYYLDPREKLRNITSLEHERLKRENPELCDVLRID